MSAIEESATTYRRRDRASPRGTGTREYGSTWGLWRMSVSASERPGCISGSRYAAVNYSLAACALRRDIEGHAVAIPGS
jgi:hypothetical protein